MNALFGEWVVSDGVGLGGLALSAFLSSTLLPGSSEVVLLLLLRDGQIAPGLLLVVASVANTLGGLSTYLIGYGLALGLLKSGRIERPQARALAWAEQWGYVVLLFSWLPLIGDGLCLAAGWLRVPWLAAVAAMFVGKAARYMMVVYLAGLY